VDVALGHAYGGAISPMGSAGGDEERILCDRAHLEEALARGGRAFVGV
jgi:hypothetical protein